LLEYYSCTNILPIPKLTELSGRKGRPKTHGHRPRTRSNTRSDLRVRPKTTRTHAPISYTDLTIFYDSSSNEGSPVRFPWSTWNTTGYRLKSSVPQTTATDLQYDLYNIQASKFANLEFGSNSRSRLTNYERKRTPIEIINVPPKPHLSIIDVNQLTRGSLEEVVRVQNARDRKFK
jgi:cytosolic carboxypeptidase protein 6